MMMYNVLSVCKDLFNPSTIINKLIPIIYPNPESLVLDSTVNIQNNTYHSAVKLSKRRLSTGGRQHVYAVESAVNVNLKPVASSKHALRMNTLLNYQLGTIQ